MDSTKNLVVLVDFIPEQSGFMFGVILLTALIAFYLFYFSTTYFALSESLGKLQFVGLICAIILILIISIFAITGEHLFNQAESSTHSNKVENL